MRDSLSVILLISLTALALPTSASFTARRTPAETDPLPAAYFRLLEAGAAKVEQRTNSIPNADLKTLEANSEWRHFPYAILAPAVLYAKRHPSNGRFRDPKMLALAIRIGDLLARENEKGAFEPRLDSDWDTYLWLEAYRLLERELGAERRASWAKGIKENIEPLVKDAKERLDFPWYHSPFIGTSPNHYAQWASLLLLGGIVFGDKEWEELGKRILRRFATEDQSPDGFWGEHNRAGPTTGYDYLTLTGVALYYEYTKDTAVIPALRRSTDFHKYYTFLDGHPVDVINDRNRRWGVSAWGQFAFTHSPDGRGYAAFLTGFFNPETLTVDQLGRLAQNALYYHEGPREPSPQELPRYSHQMTIPAGVRKTGPWQVCLSGIMSGVRLRQGLDPFDKNNWYRAKVYADSPQINEAADLQEDKQLEWTGAKERTSLIRLAPDTAPGTRIPLLLDNESWSYAWTPDVRYGTERLYQAFQLHNRHLHRYELVVPGNP